MRLEGVPRRRFFKINKRHKSFPQGDFGRPPEQVLGFRDVCPEVLRIVNRSAFKDNDLSGAKQGGNLLCDLKDRILFGVPDIEVLASWARAENPV